VSKSHRSPDNNTLAVLTKHHSALTLTVLLRPRHARRARQLEHAAAATGGGLDATGWPVSAIEGDDPSVHGAGGRAASAATASSPSLFTQQQQQHARRRSPLLSGGWRIKKRATMPAEDVAAGRGEQQLARLVRHATAAIYNVTPPPLWALAALCRLLAGDGERSHGTRAVGQARKRRREPPQETPAAADAHALRHGSSSGGGGGGGGPTRTPAVPAAAAPQGGSDSARPAIRGTIRNDSDNDDDTTQQAPPQKRRLLSSRAIAPAANNLVARFYKQLARKPK
jgi:hypothetical protein